MMKKIGMMTLFVALVFFMIVACGGSGAAGNDPFAKFTSHYDNMIKILKDNKGNPEKAQQLLTDYQQKNQAELDKLADEMEALSEQDPMKALQYGAQLMQKTAELMEATEELGISF